MLGQNFMLVNPYMATHLLLSSSASLKSICRTEPSSPQLRKTCEDSGSIESWREGGEGEEGRGGKEGGGGKGGKGGGRRGENGGEGEGKEERKRRGEGMEGGEKGGGEGGEGKEGGGGGGGGNGKRGREEGEGGGGHTPNYMMLIDTISCRAYLVGRVIVMPHPL